MKELKTASPPALVALESVSVIGYSLLLAGPGRPLGGFGPRLSGWHKSTCAPRSARDCRRSGPSLPRARSACAPRNGPRRTANRRFEFLYAALKCDQVGIPMTQLRP